MGRLPGCRFGHLQGERDPQPDPKRDEAGEGGQPTSTDKNVSSMQLAPHTHNPMGKLAEMPNPSIQELEDAKIGATSLGEHPIK